MKWLPLILLLATGGCVGLPTMERQENATTEVAEEWSKHDSETLKVALGAAASHPDGGTIEWDADNNQTGNGDQKSTASLIESIPLGIKIILIGLGIGLLLFIWRIIYNSSAAVRAAASAADTALAKQIKRYEGQLDSEGLTSEKKATILASVRELEAARGRLR